MDAVLWGNGIGNFVMATPLFQNLRKPVIYIPHDDPRREAISSISTFPVRVFEDEDNWDRFKRIYQMWTGPTLDHPNVIVQKKPKLHAWNYGHESDWNLSLVKGGTRFNPVIKCDGGWKIHTAQGEKLIGLVNGANLNWTNKQVPESKMKELCTMLRDHGHIVVFFGGIDERKQGKMLERECHVLNFAGLLTLSETINTMNQCDKIIANDSGLMHCAGAINKDIICLWGGTWWDKNKPLGKGKIVRVDGRECMIKPCYGKQEMWNCKKNICMDIDINKILEAL